MTYATLKADIASFYLNSQINASIPTFVRLAEAVIRRDVRVAAMEGLDTGSMVGGVITLPADYVDARRLVVDGYVLTYSTAEDFQDMQTAGFTTSGTAGRYFTRIGNEIHVLNGGAGGYSLLYSAAFAALSADSDTNWLLDNASDVYLFKAMVYAATFMKDAAAAQGYEALYQGAVKQLNDTDRVNRYSGSALAVSVKVPV